VLPRHFTIIDERPPPPTVRRFLFARLLFATLLLTCSLLQTAWARACSLQTAAVQAAREVPGTAARPTQGWEEVTLADTWTTRWPGYSGTAWYRIQLRQDCTAAPGKDEPLGLLVNSINMAGEIYLNDTLLWRDASLQEPLSRSWNMPRYLILPDAALQATDNAVWIRIQGQALTHPGLGKVTVGPAARLLAMHQQRSWSLRTAFVINLVATLCIAGLFAGIWLFYRREAAHGLFALMNLAWVVFIYNIVATDPWPFGDTVGVVRGNAIAFMVFITCYALFIFQQGQPLRRWQARGLPALTLCLSLLVLLAPERHLQGAVMASDIVHYLVFVAACIVPLYHAWRRRNPQDLLYALLGLASISIAVHDLYGYLSNNSQAFALTPYANLITMIVITAVLGSRIAASMRRTERFNVELTQAVEDACRELESTLEKEHRLELSNSRLQERLGFIHDLHDGFGSALVRAIVQAERQADGHAQANRHISTLKSLRDDLRNVMDSGRGVEADTPATPADWLAPTRHRFSTLFDELEMDSHWSCPPAWPMPPSVALCLELTRLLEEALSNVLKHSRATEVDITLAANAQGALTLEVRDNGVGFEMVSASDDAGGIGLHSMRARVRRLGGNLHIESRPGHSLVRASLSRPGAAPPEAAPP